MQPTPLGNAGHLMNKEWTELRQFSGDVFELSIADSSRSGKRLKMADEVHYVLEGEDYSPHWEVQEETADKYYGGIAQGAPPRNQAGQRPQHLSHDGSPLRLLASQNGIFKRFGYNKADSLEYTAEFPSVSASV